jgi:hypothetical protein
MKYFIKEKEWEEIFKIVSIFKGINRVSYSRRAVFGVWFFLGHQWVPPYLFCESEYAPILSICSFFS